VSKTYRVQQRWEVWGEKTIAADSMEQALEKAKKLRFRDFYKVQNASVSHNDDTQLDGLGVSEEW